MLIFENFKNFKDLALKAKLNIDNFNYKQLKMGFDVEKEHDGRMGKDTDVVKNDTTILKIAVAHLREDPNYYTKLKKVEK